MMRFLLIMLLILFSYRVFADSMNFQSDAKSEPSLLHYAQQGSKKQQYQLSMYYLKKKEYDKSIAWLKKSAEQNYMPAQHALGYIYLHGQGATKKNLAKAISAYKKAAAQGDTFAIAQIYLIYSGKFGGKEDLVNAYYWAWRYKMTGLGNGNIPPELKKKMSLSQLNQAQQLIQKYISE